jgi:hypothetical protein
MRPGLGIVSKNDNVGVPEKNKKKTIPIPILGLPKLISKSGSLRIGMGFILIWGLTDISRRTLVSVCG